MYSTKQLENILLAELSRKQERKFMEDVSQDAEISYKEIWQVRKKEVYQRIFGNKYRIWIPLDIAENKEISDDKYFEFENLFKKYNSSVLDWYLLKTVVSLIDNYYFVMRNSDIFKINKTKLLLLWIKGYFIDPTSTTSTNTRFVKIGSLINKLISLTKKKYSTDTEKENRFCRI